MVLLAQAGPEMSTELLPPDIRKTYEAQEWKHACAILKNDFPKEWADIIEVLRGFKLLRAHMLERGGGPGPYLELFARHHRAGWSQWGNEIPEPSINGHIHTNGHSIVADKNGHSRHRTERVALRSRRDARK